jgi:hypothetical protein
MQYGIFGERLASPSSSNHYCHDDLKLLAVFKKDHALEVEASEKSPFSTQIGFENFLAKI